MAPLDTGSVVNLRLVDPLGERFGPSPDEHATIGAYLRAVREHKGMTLADLAASTRIRRTYLQGLEEGDRSNQPSRPFAIGYVRSYAEALGIDGDAAAARFKRETPEVDDLFRDPVGVAHEKRKRSPLILAVVGLVVTGVVFWNVVQRTMQQEDREAPALLTASSEPVAPAPANTVVAIGAATPAPAAQNLPEAYVTPGLPGSPIGPDGKPVVQTPQQIAEQAAAQPVIPAVFTPKGAVYGAPAGPAAEVVLQARKPVSLIVRGAGGAVYFARQLAAGEAFRAPSGEGLTAETSDPASVTYYVDGENKGALSSQQTALDKLAVHPAAAAVAPVRPTVAAHLEPMGQRQPARADVAYYRQPPAR